MSLVNAHKKTEPNRIYTCTALSVRNILSFKRRLPAVYFREDCAKIARRKRKIRRGDGFRTK